MTSTISEALNLFEALHRAATREQVTTAARSLYRLDEVPIDKQGGWHQAADTLCASEAGVVSWLQSEMDKWSAGLWVSQRWEAVKSDAVRARCLLIVGEACRALIAAGVGTDASPT